MGVGPNRSDESITRRRLLQMGGAAAVASGLALPAGAAGASRSTTPAWLKRSSYASTIGDAFSIRTGGATVIARLVEVADLQGTTQSGRPLTGREDAFALILDASASSGAPQGTYRVQHPDVGDFEALVVPERRSDTTQTYVIVVNRTR